MGARVLRLAHRTGETTELLLTFSGDVAADTEPDSIDVLDDDRVKVIGTAVGRTDDAHADVDDTLITSGGLQFAIRGRRQRLASAVQANFRTSGTGGRLA